MTDLTRQYQRDAANPQQSVWVSANAGTGKTRVLVDRLLRLLLADVPSHGILCITFTKAAAAEIAERIRHRLASWVTYTDTDLVKDLTDINGVAPDAVMLNKSRHLFSRLLNSERQLSIQTIHSFCQSVLARFPLEAGLLPGFAIASDQQAAQLQQQAFQHVLSASNTDAPLRQACENLFNLNDHTQILGLLKNLQHQQDKWLDDRTVDFSVVLRRILGVAPDLNSKTHLQSFYQQTQEQELYLVAGDLSDVSGTTAPKLQQAIQTFLQTASQQKGIEAYFDSLLTQKGTINHNMAGLVKKLSDSSANALQNEFNRIADHIQTAQLLDIAERNQDILRVASHFAYAYRDLKQLHALLDYNDQIRLTAGLLTKADNAPWVMYKLDGGIRHLLVDEAQDTSPAQWSIIRALATEMAAGNSIHDAQERSVFIVGDEKQSIYSFQDADIASYQTTRRELHQIFAAAQLPWHDIQLITNFRSSPAILDVVDGVFDNPQLKGAITQEDKVKHSAYHHARSGHVEIWPLFANDAETADEDYIPTTIVQERKATEHLCQTLADTIKDWLKAGRQLPRMGRPVQPGDIMILLQNRRPLLNPLIKALKDRQIPVSGVDRLVLTEQLIVMDLIAMLQIILLPQDDLTMASLLKSPFFNITEKQLFDLAHDRGSHSLWQRLQDSGHYQMIIAYIDGLLQTYRQGAGPYHLLSLMVNRPCPADARSGRHALIERLGFDAEDALDELLNAALQFEQDEMPDVQLFLQWLSRNDAEIKRDTANQQHNHVRIMTVHGAKGLQAPIVFLADASAKPSLFKPQRDLLWTQDTPLWINSKEQLPTSLLSDLGQQEKATLDEYYRLLYVAMTRAEDELYLTGWKKDRETQKDIADWHAVLWPYLSTHGQPLTPDAEDSAWRFSFTGQDKSKPDDKKTTSLQPVDLKQLPWLWQKPPVIPNDNPHPLKPSHSPFNDLATISPLQQDHHARFARGVIVHKILQYLVDYPADEQLVALKAMLAYPEFSLPEADQKNLYKEIARLVTDPQMQFIFTASGHNEVSVTGSVFYNNKEFAVVGVIDRLVFHDDAWWIIDYKTNRPPAATLETVPDSYLFQMASYRALIQALYPQQNVHGVLVWTYSSSFMRLPDERLDAIIHSDKSRS
ncbi:MAG TPA: double-strand break repair helicase AddA [Alphaproteobacteria bacterium]